MMFRGGAEFSRRPPLAAQGTKHADLLSDMTSKMSEKKLVPS